MRAARGDPLCSRRRDVGVRPARPRVAHQPEAIAARLLRRSVQQSRVSAARRDVGAHHRRRRIDVHARSVRCAHLCRRENDVVAAHHARRRNSRVRRREGDLVIERNIATGTHGRYLVATPAGGAPAPLLVGFHGYAEGAEAQLERMQKAPAAARWLVVAIQGLHRFYQRRANDVVASWMTRQDRELAIADNIAYVNAVVDAVVAEWPNPPRIVYAGFSQGVAMTFRAAARSRRPLAGVIAAGGDVPPELDAAALSGIPAVLVCRGSTDEWYTTEKFDGDIGRLRAAGSAVTPLSFDGGHEWSDAVVKAASVFLEGR